MPQQRYSLKSTSVTYNHRATVAAEEARDRVSDDEYGEMLSRARQSL